jgi:hypothetical protein
MKHIQLQEKVVRVRVIDLVASMIDKEAARKIHLLPLLHNKIEMGIQDCAAEELDELV